MTVAVILIVEDEPSINELIQRNLKLVGHTCFSCTDGISALEEIRRRPFDLMLLDVMLPKLDGFSVYEQSSAIPTIFLTARGQLADRVKGLTMGADD